MRSREMLTKLDRLPVKTELDNRFPDISMLTPEDQDRAHELHDKICSSDPLKHLSELRELAQLLSPLPLIGRDDRRGGPNLNVPRALEGYWKWTQPASTWRSYSFWKLKAVQKVRFVELCRTYGWQEGTSPKTTMLPLNDWDERDQDEMDALLDEAASLP